MLADLIKKFHLGDRLSREEERIVQGNIRCVFSMLQEWVPLCEWEEHVQKLSAEEVHWTMRLACRRILTKHFRR